MNMGLGVKGSFTVLLQESETTRLTNHNVGGFFGNCILLKRY